VGLYQPLASDWIVFSVSYVCASGYFSKLRFSQIVSITAVELPLCFKRMQCLHKNTHLVNNLFVKTNKWRRCEFNLIEEVWWLSFRQVMVWKNVRTHYCHGLGIYSANCRKWKWKLEVSDVQYRQSSSLRVKKLNDLISAVVALSYCGLSFLISGWSIHSRHI